ncbi:MAG TPA: type IV secretion system DNA-binding domain-containing protein [Steroidobacteraceae bacterium]|nr:type IV secretion system DNA-binding domain-containing protein [Steroidobacteraceae bacterium]
MIDAALTGWSGFLVAYGAAQAPMIAGLIKGRAAMRHYALSPLVALPLTAISAAGASIVGAHGLVHFAITAAAGAFLGYAGGRATAREGVENSIHQRGSLIAEAPAPRQSRSRSLGADAAITLAGVAIPAMDEAKHFKLIGTTGTGKSTAVQEILSAALARGDRAVIADPDGGYLRRFHQEDRGDIILNPFDERSVKWDLFKEIRNPYDVEQLARSLIPDHEGPDRSWRGYARTFFAAVTRQAHNAGISDVGELYRLLVIADSSELRGLVRGTPAQPFLEEQNSRMFDSIRSVASSAVGALDYVAQQKSSGFSVRDWVDDEKPGVLFMPYKAGQIAALRSSISAWMRLAIFETMDQGDQSEGKARLWFVVDELDALGQIDGLKDALARLRKFNGRCVLGFQSLAQVSSTYGQGDAHTIVENCSNTLILRCSASEGGGTARFASQLIGEREVLRTTESTSRRATEVMGSVSRSRHFTVESAVLPSQVEQLPDLTGYLKYASDPTWLRVRLDAKSAWNAAKSTPAAALPDERVKRFFGAECE